ncbi:MAG: hypothetical protein ABI548_27530 [Polyangiaceae bacterium]
MTGRRSSPELGANLEAALASFPVTERDWEKEALAVEARLSKSDLGSTDAALLAAPLPNEPGEPNAPLSATATPLTHSGVRTQSLADIARRSVENKQAAEREMARETLMLASKRPSALEVRALREVMNSKLPPAPPSAADVGAAPLAQASAGVVSARHAATVPHARAAAARSPWPHLGLAAVGIALAAGVLFWLRQPAPIPVPMVVAAPPAEAPKATTTDLNANGVAEPARVPAAPLAPVAVAPDALPEIAVNAAQPTHDKAIATGAHSPAPNASGAGPKPEKVELEDAPATPVASAPAASPAEQAVANALPPDPTMRPADSTGGAVPAKPSTGAVQAALGAVMSGARHCVAGNDAPSSAVLVFASDGHVQSVSVSGAAAGKPSGGCIEAQLSRARVQPFAGSSFSVSATVRPD